MRKVTLMCVAVLASALSASAQSYSKAEAFVGYSFTRFRGADSGVTFHSNLNGGVGQVTFNATGMFGFVGEFSGSALSSITATAGGTTVNGSASGSEISYLFGPRVSFRGERSFHPFAQALFGGSHLSTLTSSSSTLCGGTTPCTLNTARNAFATAIGGGFDMNATKHIAIRLGDFDYLLTGFDLGSGASNQNSFRYVAGIVIH